MCVTRLVISLLVAKKPSFNVLLWRGLLLSSEVRRLFMLIVLDAWPGLSFELIFYAVELLFAGDVLFFISSAV